MINSTQDQLTNAVQSKAVPDIYVVGRSATNRPRLATSHCDKYVRRAICGLGLSGYVVSTRDSLLVTRDSSDRDGIAANVIS